jgi:hypothetical protein
MVLRSPTGAQWTVKNESRFSTAKSTAFYSEFNADSEYIILFGRKNGLIDTCPLRHSQKKSTIIYRSIENFTGYYTK